MTPSPPRSRRRSAAAEIADLASRAGADDALESLVGQFADPLAFLRELIQNSLDAASTRIEVTFQLADDDAIPDQSNDAAASPPPAQDPATPEVEVPGERTGGKKKKRNKKKRKKKGKSEAGTEAAKQVTRAPATRLMTISVVDNGEGMNEGIIDRYLLTLFSSTKENDLTKIGKFGVGFVSIFAIEPELVVLDTGQSGESWRILFSADRSFEKLRSTEPMEGTRICLYKRVTAEEFADIRRRGTDTVRYWCKYAEAEIRVDDATIGEPFAIDAGLPITYREPGTELVLGFAPRKSADATASRISGTAAAATLEALAGFYNRGLTLIEAAQPPGDQASELCGLSLRLKSRYLEHTLTRDNVRQDENYHKAIALVRARVEDRLRPALIAHLEGLARDPDEPAEPGLALALLYARLPAMKLHETAPRAAIFATVGGAPHSFRDLARADRPTGKLLSAEGENPVTALLRQRGIPVVLDSCRVVADHLEACGLEVEAADQQLYTAVRVDVDSRTRELLDRVAELLDRAKARVQRVVLGDLDYPRSSVSHALCIRQERAFELTQRGKDDRVEWLGGARELVVNSSHSLVRTCLELAAARPALAAQILAQTLAVAEGADRQRTVQLAAGLLADRAAALTAADEEA